VVCFDEGIKWGFLGALLFLQAIQIMWFFMIMRVAIQVLKGAAADDVRSDDEEEEEEEEDEIDVEGVATIEELDDSPPPYEEEVGVEQINLKGRTAKTRSLRKSNSSSSGISLPHSDRKELLGRIGCDKGV
jgi:acyl-CoA-dependent ceramide synthase